MTDPDAQPMTLVTATCHTAGCSNADYAAELYVPEQPWPPSITCGVCGQPIDAVVRGGAS
jgi:hypothetical protein